MIALFCFHIENRIFTLARDALFAIEEGSGNRAVCNIRILHASLVVLFNNAVDTLSAEYPVYSIEIALKDSWRQNNAATAVRIDYRLDAIEDGLLSFDVLADGSHFRVVFDLSCQSFQLV